MPTVSCEQNSASGEAGTRVLAISSRALTQLVKKHLLHVPIILNSDVYMFHLGENPIGSQIRIVHHNVRLDISYDSSLNRLCMYFEDILQILVRLFFYFSEHCVDMAADCYMGEYFNVHNIITRHLL